MQGNALTPAPNQASCRSQASEAAVAGRPPGLGIVFSQLRAHHHAQNTERPPI